MKITRSRLQKIIKEELEKIIEFTDADMDRLAGVERDWEGNVVRQLPSRTGRTGKSTKRQEKASEIRKKRQDKAKKEELDEEKKKMNIKKMNLKKGRCTPMGTPECPEGSPQYNLAKRFKSGDIHKDNLKKGKNPHGPG